MAFLACRSSERATVHGKRLRDGLQTPVWRPSVGEVHGNGMRAGIGLVDDKGTRKPALGRAPRVVADAGKRGLIILQRAGGDSPPACGDSLCLAHH